MRERPLVADQTVAVDDVPALEARGIRAAYDHLEVLHGVDLTVPSGSIFAVLGPNGAGKSTLLKVLCGALRPSGGSVHIEGHDVTGTSIDRLAKAGVCLIPEGRGIFPNLTVHENVLMDTFTCARRTSAAHLEEIAYERFPRLRDRRHQIAGTLSGGEQQMLALARALTTDPAVILLDELSMGLAPMIVSHLFGIVRDLAATGVTTIVVEQFAGVLAFADHAAVLGHGQIRLQGPPDEVRAQLSAAYLGSER